MNRSTNENQDLIFISAINMVGETWIILINSIGVIILYMLMLSNKAMNVYVYAEYYSSVLCLVMYIFCNISPILLTCLNHFMYLDLVNINL